MGPCRAKQAAEERFETVILSAAKNLALCIFKKIRRARSFAAPCTVRYGAALSMTTLEGFSAACKARRYAKMSHYKQEGVGVV